MAMPRTSWSCQELSCAQDVAARGFVHEISVPLPTRTFVTNGQLPAPADSPSRLDVRRERGQFVRLSISRVTSSRQLPWDEACEMVGELAEVWASLALQAARPGCGGRG